MITTTAIVIVYGPPPAGDTTGRLLNYFGCSRLVAAWDGRAELKGGDLAITNRQPPFRAKGALVLSLAEAMVRIAAATRRRA